MEKTYIREPSYTIAYLFRKILVPIDGSSYSLRAASVAIDFAQRYGSRLTFIHITSSKNKEEAEKIFDEVKKMVYEAGIEAEFKIKKIDIPKSSVAAEIIKEAREGLYSAIIMGSRGLSESEDLTIGETALSISTFAPCSVLIIR